MSCRYSEQVQAYHDGELAGGQRQAFEDHLAACAHCAQELASLRRLSAALSGAAMPRLPESAVQRLRRQYRPAQERGLLRIAELLTAAAAAVLLVGLVGLLAGNRAQGQPAAWEQAMVTLQVESVPAAEASPAVDWMAMDLALRGQD